MSYGDEMPERPTEEQMNAAYTTIHPPVTPPPWQRKFYLGELLPWKQEWFEVVSMGKAGIVMKRKEKE